MPIQLPSHYHPASRARLFGRVRKVFHAPKIFSTIRKIKFAPSELVL
jgi:hypothetical protein